MLTRPLGATLGDTLTKPHAEGGMDFSRLGATGAIAAAMAVLVLLSPRLRRAAVGSPKPAG